MCVCVCIGATVEYLQDDVTVFAPKFVNLGTKIHGGVWQFAHHRQSPQPWDRKKSECVCQCWVTDACVISLSYKYSHTLN